MNLSKSVVSILLLCLSSSITLAQDKPNIVLVFMDNFGWGEPGFNGGGIVRGAETPRLDALAAQGLRLTNFNVEVQCTPSRSAIMTGRYAIRSGNSTVPLGEGVYGLVQWEVTMAAQRSEAPAAAASCRFPHRPAAEPGGAVPRVRHAAGARASSASGPDPRIGESLAPGPAESFRVRSARRGPWGAPGRSGTFYSHRRPYRAVYGFGAVPSASSCIPSHCPASHRELNPRHSSGSSPSFNPSVRGSSPRGPTTLTHLKGAPGASSIG